MQVSGLIGILKKERAKFLNHKSLLFALLIIVMSMAVVFIMFLFSRSNYNSSSLSQDQAIDYMLNESPNTFSNRKFAVVILIIIFISSSVIMGKRKAFGSVLSLFLSGIVLIKFMIPMILYGYNPIVVSILSGLLLLIIIMYLSHGVNKKSNLALVGTFMGVLITVGLGVLMVNLGDLNGFTSENEIYILMETGRELQMKYILIASVIIAGIGIIDDLAVNQVSVVIELFEVNKSLTIAELFKRAMKVGNDHISSMVNTLIFAYAGSSFTLLMFYTLRADSLSQLIEFEPFAEEVFRTLITSVGLILAVPITTIISAWYIRKTEVK